MAILQIEKPNGQICSVKISESGQTLLSILHEQHIFIDAPCGGKGNCGKCKVIFAEGMPEPTAKEREMLTEKQLAEGVRLACAVKIEHDCLVSLPEQGAIHTVCGLQEQENLYNVCERQGAPSNVDGTAPYTCGIAVDIGTTTLAAELIELCEGTTLAVATAVNHQRSYGADVISRIQASNEGKGELLRESIKKDLWQLTGKLLQEARVAPELVKKMVIAGNTTMCHLLLGFSCETLGTAPFEPVDISLGRYAWRTIFEESCGGEVAAIFGKNMGKFMPEITILPGISAFVGADIVAGIYGSGMAAQEKTILLLDIGTNGEMVIGNRDGFLATSAAAGPVFEGGNISCGVAGVPGAITHVKLQKIFSDGREEIAVETEQYGCKGRRPQMPVGLCGTGIIDLVSELVREKLIDENGTFTESWLEDGLLLIQGENENLTASDGTGKQGDFPVCQEEIRFLQEDIREVQVGKAAIRAGIETLISEYGKEPDKVYLAGGFGSFMNIDAAVCIGLFPEYLKEKIVPIGNAVLAGAKSYLLLAEQERIEWIAAHTKEINLAMHPKFNTLFIESMDFL